MSSSGQSSTSTYPAQSITSTFLDQYTSSLHSHSPSQSTTALTYTSITTIHPLLSRANFRICPVDKPGLNYCNRSRLHKTRHILPNLHYARLHPALRLASAFLQQSRPFFAKIAFAPLRHSPTTTTTSPTTLLDESYVPSETDLTRLDKDLISLATVLRFFKSASKIVDSHARATCVNFLTDRYLASIADTHRPPVAIILNADTYTFFTQPTQIWTVCPAHVKRMMSFDLAVTLCHELAHAIWMMRYLRANGRLTSSLAAKEEERGRKKNAKVDPFVSSSPWWSSDAGAPVEEVTMQNDLRHILHLFHLKGWDARLMKRVSVRMTGWRRGQRQTWVVTPRMMATMVGQTRSPISLDSDEFRVGGPSSTVGSESESEDEVETETEVDAPLPITEKEPSVHPAAVEPELGRAWEEYIFGGVTWGVYWRSMKQIRGEREVNLRVPEMYFSKWIWKDEQQSEEGVEGAEQGEEGEEGEEEGEGEGVRAMRKRGRNSWEDFVRERRSDLVPVSAELLVGMFGEEDFA